ncbi:GNVR domain-containing protein [Chromobacterium subtsugae]|uniref:GNVR domain-containing protein n=1 Tax=Chromobacterium subtsugae TaxID=251747 RepID=UPI0006417684|nr:GNVR domain-containing protein [Chromobacterium subtsugae]
MEREENEIALLKIGQFGSRNWRVLLAGFCLSALSGLAASLAMPNLYTARTLLTIAAPIGAQGGASVLQSDGVLQRMVDKFALVDHYQSASPREAKLELVNSRLKLSPTKEGLLEVSVTDASPELAAQLANGLAEISRQQILDAHITEQGRKQYVLQEKLAAARAQLKQAEAEVAARVPGGEASLDMVTVGIISGFAGLEGQLEGGQSSNLGSAILQMRKELEGSNRVIRQLPSGQMLALRNLYFNRALIRELQQQLQVARVVASQDVQVVLPAAAPLEKSAPKRVIIVLLSGMAGLLLAALAVIALQHRGRSFSRRASA